MMRQFIEMLIIVENKSEKKFGNRKRQNSKIFARRIRMGNVQKGKTTTINKKPIY